jgi:hypothetical protein
MNRKRNAGKWLAIALVAAFLPTTSMADNRCRVMDPTGTPLNVRTSPYGRVLDTLPNGMLVSILDTARDRQGKAWVYVASYENSIPLGWVFREFISCF